MKLTPLDIRHKEFRNALRGYNEDEVDVFLDEVADEVERLFKENIDLSERLEHAGERVRSYQEIEQTLQNTLVTAQKSAEDIVGGARKESELVARDAELKAKEIIQAALGERQKIHAELMRTKRAEGEFRQQFRAMLEAYLAGMKEISIPADVRLEDEAPAMMSGAPAMMPEPVAVAEEPAAPAPAPEAEPVYEVDAAPDYSAAPVTAEEPEPAGTVSAVTLGEVGESEIVAEPVFAEPAEFSMPSFGAIGEAEDDIEEID
jgi:cell division initiation protein